MKRFSRRRWMKQSSLLSLTPLPSLLAGSCNAATNMGQDRVLVVIQMSGGNDGLNTVVPFRDEQYSKHRQKLRLPESQLIKITEDCALHPAMRDAADLWEDGQWSIIQSVGYPNPNRSHDVSMSIWQSGERKRKGQTPYGWLGSSMDASDSRLLSGHPSMVLMGDEALPLAIHGRLAQSACISEMRDLELSAEVPTCSTTRRMSPSSHSVDDLLGFVRKTSEQAERTASSIQVALDSKQTSSNYPSTGLAKRLQNIATLIKSGFSTSVYYAIQPGYDTHAAQLPAHSRLLRELSGGVKAFLDDMDVSGLSERVVVFAFSEFGRRVAENASQGTDHGAAGPVFLAGRGVKGGLFGEPSSLNDLHRGDVRMRTDFRSVYASLLSDWMGLEPQYSNANQHQPIQGLFASSASP